MATQTPEEKLAAEQAAAAAEKAAAEAKATADDNAGALLKGILGLIKPEDKKVTPDAKTPEQIAAEKAATEAATKKAADEKAASDAAAAAKAAEEAAAGGKKKVTVSKAKPGLTKSEVADAVKETLAEKAAAEKAAADKLAAEKAATDKAKAAELPEDLTADERDEVELARFIESKDPAKKGLADKTLKFFEEQKKFLEKRIAEVGEEYDPANDPKFKQFLEKNRPQMTSAERRRAAIQRETESIRAEALEQAKKELMPEIEKTKRKVLEIEEQPKVTARVHKYIDEVASTLAPEVHEFYVKNGRDVEKTRAEYPLEFAIATETTAGIVRLATDFLNLRHGLVDFDASNNSHKYMHNFVDTQGRVFAERGGEALIRDGKQFIHPFQFKPGMEKTHWTFENDDVLTMLKLQAQMEAKARIEAEHKRIEAIQAANARRTAAQNGAVKKAAETPAAKSPEIGAGSSPGAAKTEDKTGIDPVSRILGFKPQAVQ